MEIFFQFLCRPHDGLLHEVAPIVLDSLRIHLPTSPTMRGASSLDGSTTCHVFVSPVDI